MGTSQLKLGSIISYLNVFLNIAVSLLLSPLTVRSLGSSEYGLYQLIWSFVGYMSVLDLGFTNAVIRYIAKYRAENDLAGQERFLGMAMVIYLVISGVILLVGSVLFFQLGNIFTELTVSELALAKKLFVIMLLNFIMNIFLNIFPAIINGYERFVFQRGVVLTRFVLRSAVVATALLMGGKGLTLALIDTVFTILFFLVQMFYVRVRLKIRLQFKGFDFTFFKEVFSYSVFVFMGIVVDQINWKVDQFIIGVKMPVSQVGVYSIALQFPMYYMSFSNALSGVFLPKATKMAMTGATDRDFTDLMIHVARVQWAILGIMLLGFGFFGQQFIRLWVGDDYSAAYPIAIMIMTALTIPLFQSVGLSIQQAKNRHRFRAVLYLSIAVVNVILTVILVDRMGIVGAAVGTVISYVIGNIIIMNIYYRAKLGIEVGRFFRELCRGMLPATLIMLAVGFGLNFISVQTWGTLILKVAVFGLLYLPVFAVIGLNQKEKHEYFALLRKRLKP